MNFGIMGISLDSSPTVSFLRKHSRTFCDRIFSGSRTCSVPSKSPEPSKWPQRPSCSASAHLPYLISPLPLPPGGQQDPLQSPTRPCSLHFQGLLTLPGTALPTRLFFLSSSSTNELSHYHIWEPSLHPPKYGLVTPVSFSPPTLTVPPCNDITY